MTAPVELRLVRLTGAAEKFRELLREASTLDRIGEVWTCALDSRRNGQIEGLCVAALQIERDDAIERLSPKGAEGAA